MLTKPKDLNAPCIVFSGVVNYPYQPEDADTYLNRLQNASILNVLLANFAAHPQYSGNLKHEVPIFASHQHCASTGNLASQPVLEQEVVSFNHFKDYAEQIGCTLSNPKLLFLNHIYCDTLAKY